MPVSDGLSFGLRRKIGDERSVQNVEKRVLSLDPNGVSGTPGFSRAGFSFDQTNIEIQRAVDGLNRCAWRSDGRAA
jgi:hypothetical protein